MPLLGLDFLEMLVFVLTTIGLLQPPPPPASMRLLGVHFSKTVLPIWKGDFTSKYSAYQTPMGIICHLTINMKYEVSFIIHERFLEGNTFFIILIFWWVDDSSFLIMKINLKITSEQTKILWLLVWPLAPLCFHCLWTSHWKQTHKKS